MLSYDEQSVDKLEAILQKKLKKKESCSEKILRLENPQRIPGSYQIQDSKGYVVVTNFTGDSVPILPDGALLLSRPETFDDFKRRLRVASHARIVEEDKLRELNIQIDLINDIINKKKKDQQMEEERLRLEEEQREADEINRQEKLEYHKILIPTNQLEAQIKKEWIFGGISVMEPFEWNSFKEFFERIYTCIRDWKRADWKDVNDTIRADREINIILEKFNGYIFMETNSPIKNSSIAIILKDEEFPDKNIIKRPGKDWFKDIFGMFNVSTTEMVTNFILQLERKDKKKSHKLESTNVFELWKKWKSGMKVINQVIFNPTRNPGFDQNVFNEWEGFRYYYDHDFFLTLSIEEYDQVVEDFKHHFEDIICRSQPEVSSYLIKWMAWVRQNPGKKSEVVPVLIGAQGCGKTMAIQMFASLFGTHGTYISDYKDIFKQFNHHLMSKKLFLGCDEIKFNDDDVMNTLKNLITARERRTEEKFGELKQIQNYLNIMMSTNSKEKLSCFDQGLNRRFLLIEVDSTYQGSASYFDKLVDMFITGPNVKINLRIIDRFLCTIDLTDFKVRDCPVTDILINQIIRSLNKVEKWWFDVLEAKKHVDYPINNDSRFNNNIQNMVVDPNCPTWVLHPVKIKDLHNKFLQDTSMKINISFIDFQLSLSNMVNFDEQQDPTTFPSYEECNRWKKNLGGKKEVIKLRGKKSLTIDQAQKTLTERKRSQKRKRDQFEGQSTFRNFFQNS